MTARIARIAGQAAITFAGLLAVVIAGCAGPPEPQPGASPGMLATLNALMTEMGNKTYHRPDATLEFYPKLTNEIISQDCYNSGGGCIWVKAENFTILDFAVVTGGRFFAKVRIVDGREGWTPFDKLKKVVNPPPPRKQLGIPRLGMDELAASNTCWGLPERENSTQVRGHTFVQWVFPNNAGYLYFTDGKVTAIQVTGSPCVF